MTTMNTTPPRPLHPDDGALYACTNRRARRARAAQHRSAQRVAHRRQVRAVARSRPRIELRALDLASAKLGKAFDELADAARAMIESFAKATNEILAGFRLPASMMTTGGENRVVAETHQRMTHTRLGWPLVQNPDDREVGAAVHAKGG
jgi:hypothetical protein